MQHSIGGGAPWPGLVIGAAVYPKIPQQIQITGQQVRILRGGWINGQLLMSNGDYA